MERKADKFNLSLLSRFLHTLYERKFLYFFLESLAVQCVEQVKINVIGLELLELLV